MPKFLEEVKQTLQNKGQDYTATDALENFKLIAGVDPKLAVLIQLHIKLHRLTNLVLHNKEPKNESIDDNIKDLAGYTTLFKMIILEERGVE